MSSAGTARPHEKAVAGAMVAFADELIEEDYVVYSRMLDQWSKDRDNRSGDVANAVHLMAGFCAIRSIAEFVPSLLTNSLRQKLFVPFDEGEQPFIDEYIGRPSDANLLSQYDEWLASKGFTGMATRLLVASQDEGSRIRRSRAG
jgi:hypothetical protein